MAEVSTIVSLVKEYLQKPDESSLEAWTSYCTSKQTQKAKEKQTLCLVVEFVKLPRSNTPMVNSFTCFHLFYFINSLLRMCGCLQNIMTGISINPLLVLLNLLGHSSFTFQRRALTFSTLIPIISPLEPDHPRG